MLPQLGALSAVTGGGPVSAEMRADLMRRSEAFRAELPKMLEEHKAIGAALREMAEAAAAEKKAGPQRLAEKILGHGAMEEKALYPATLLLGEYAAAAEKAKRPRPARGRACAAAARVPAGALPGRRSTGVFAAREAARAAPGCRVLAKRLAPLPDAP